jgi:hypothetical protein
MAAQRKAGRNLDFGPFVTGELPLKGVRLQMGVLVQHALKGPYKCETANLVWAEGRDRGASSVRGWLLTSDRRSGLLQAGMGQSLCEDGNARGVAKTYGLALRLRGARELKRGENCG